MKKFLLFTILFACWGGMELQAGEPSGPSVRETGAEPEREHTVRFLFVPGQDVFSIPWKGNGSELDTLYTLLDRYESEIFSGAMPVYVDGYSASMRDPKRNIDLAFVRANRVKSELILRRGLTEDHFRTRNFITAWTGPDGQVHKDVVVVTLRIPPRAQHEPMAEPEPEPVVREEMDLPEDPDIFVTVRRETLPEPEPVPAPRSTGGLDIRTNLLYDALLTPTIGLEWRIDNHVGIKLDGSWAHWGSSHGRVQKMWLVSPEVRWYLLESKRFYVGVGANIGEANVYRGLAKILSDDTGYQGRFYGGGVTVGYRLPLCEAGRMAIDFNLGLGLTHFRYDTFHLSNGYRVYRERDRIKNFWGPTQAGISLVWRIGEKNVK